jgi:hypothetical protein
LVECENKRDAVGAGFEIKTCGNPILVLQRQLVLGQSLHDLFPLVSYANGEEEKVCAYSDNVVVCLRLLGESIDRMPNCQEAADNNDE